MGSEFLEGERKSWWDGEKEEEKEEKNVLVKVGEMTFASVALEIDGVICSKSISVCL